MSPRVAGVASRNPQPAKMGFLVRRSEALFGDLGGWDSRMGLLGDGKKKERSGCQHTSNPFNRRCTRAIGTGLRASIDKSESV
jgi:hypothetical protein